MKIVKHQEAFGKTRTASCFFMCFMVAALALVTATARQNGPSPTAVLASQMRVPATVDSMTTVYEPRSDSGYVTALQTLMPLVDVTFGVEAFGKSGYEPRFSGRLIPIAGRTVGEILDDLDRAFPEYTWRDVDGAILIEPVRGGPSFLETTVQSFDVTDDTIQGSIFALARMFDAAAPSTRGSSLNVQCMLNRADECRLVTDATDRSSRTTASVSLRNTTAREILTRICRAFHSRYWLVQHLDETRGYDNSRIILELGGSGATTTFTPRRR